MLTKIKISTHAKMIAGLVIIAFVTNYMGEPTVVAWLSAHPGIRDLAAAIGGAFHVWNSYSNPKTPV